jgi:hypothetical protein
MAWRMVKQPDGMYARFADPVDHFTHFNMTLAEALRYCQDELGLAEGMRKVVNADSELGRWADSLDTIELIHGTAERIKTEKEILSNG